MDGMTRNLIGNIGEDWKGIRDDGDQEEQKKERHQKQSRKEIRKMKKKMSKNTRRVEQKNGMKKMRWIIYKIYMMSCKIFGTRILKRGGTVISCLDYDNKL